MKTKASWLLALYLFVANSPAFAASKPAEKIIALSPHSVELLFAMGAGDKVVATTEHADYPLAAQSIERIGGFHGVQIERILEINPDLIVVWQSGNKREQISQLKQLGFNLYYSNPTNLDSIADEIVALGALVGKENTAQQLANSYRQRLTSLRKKYHQQPQVKVFYQLWSQPLQTVAANSWIGEMLNLCGGDNIFADAGTAYPQVSLESVLIKKPQVLILPIDKESGRLPDHINWQQWPEIPAVTSGHLYRADADLLHRASIRALDGLESLCQAIDNAR
jgi:vitamin B12 transport system substrate-binding protein